MRSLPMTGRRCAKGCCRSRFLWKPGEPPSLKSFCRGLHPKGRCLFRVFSVLLSPFEASWTQMEHPIVKDLRKLWHLMPHKGVFFALFAAWTALFHFFGNSTFGHTSMFDWMRAVYSGYEDDSHCSFIPLVVLALLVWKRKVLMNTPTRPWWPAVGLVAVALILHLAGFAVQQTRLSIVGFVLGLYGLTGLVWGPAWLRNTFFPMFLLLFLVPISAISESITLPLRLVATRLAVGFSNAVLGIEVFHNGSQILGPDNVPLYEVAPACSGIRSLTVLGLLMLVYAWITFRSWWRRGVMIASAVPVAILGNVLRLITVIVAGEAFSPDAAVAVEQNLGFLTFALGLVCMFALGRWLGEADSESEPAKTGSAPEGAALEQPRPLAAAGVVILMTVGAAIALGRIQGSMHLGDPGLRVIQAQVLGEEGKVVGTNTVDLPIEVLDYSSETQPITDLEVSSLPSDTTFARRHYTAARRPGLLLNVVLMGTNRRSIHRPQICLTGQGWTIERTEELEISISKPHRYRLPVMRLIASRPFRDRAGRTQLVKAVYVYWFVADQQLTARHGQRMWEMARDLLLDGVQQRWAYVSCLAIGTPGSEQALYQQMETFLAAAVPEFQVAPGARSSHQAANAWP